MGKPVPFYKFSITAAISVLIIIAPTSCFFFEDCPKPAPYFNINGLHISNLAFENQGIYAEYVYDTNESIRWDNYFMRIGFEKTFYSELKTSGGQNLYALSCTEPGYLGSKFGVDTIYLISLHDYNDRYHENDTLNEIISINHDTYKLDQLVDFFSLPTYIQQNKDRILKDVDIKFNEPPSDDSNFYRFKLVFWLKNGLGFAQTGDSIRLSR